PVATSITNLAAWEKSLGRLGFFGCISGLVVLGGAANHAREAVIGEIAVFALTGTVLADGAISRGLSSSSEGALTDAAWNPAPSLDHFLVGHGPISSARAEYAPSRPARNPYFGLPYSKEPTTQWPAVGQFQLWRMWLTRMLPAYGLNQNS